MNVLSRLASVQWIKLSGLVAIALLSLMLWATPAAWAGLNDDHYDGNIFALYSGNGSLVPARVTMAEAVGLNRPALLVFYIDDSSDCKIYSSVISQLDAFYGREADFIPVAVDAIPRKASYTPLEPGYYYKGVVPQTVVLDQSGKVVLDAKGIVPFEQVDDVFRQVFDLLPRNESVELRRRRPINEFNTEIIK